VVLGDGAAWVWHQAALHYPNNRVEVLDFYHASEHLGLVAKAYYGETRPTGAHRHQKQAQRLLARGGAQRVLQVLQRMPAERAQVQEVIKDNLRYFENNLERMNYSEYRKRGYHIGSGLAESACKHLVGKRLKQSGMTNWSEPGAEAILRLRVVIENGRFDQ
jgi:tartrate dehydratase beta subunit/fumarate hydratase class I family protein